MFVALLNQGLSPAEAFTAALILAIGGAEIIRRHDRGRDDNHNDSRWA